MASKGKKEKFVFLTSVSDFELNLVLQKLKQDGIRYEVKDLPENAPIRRYGAQASVGGRIFVLSSELTRAKQVLGLGTHRCFAKQFKHTPLAVRIFIILMFGSLIVLILLSVFFSER